MPVCHAGLEPQASRPQTGLLLTCASLALDRHFPNRYAAYLETGGFGDAKKALP